jgi:hypothetical protein
VEFSRTEGVLWKANMGDRLFATPVLVNNRLLIRGTAYLYCIGAK